jgi:hypothetical protein
MFLVIDSLSEYSGFIRVVFGKASGSVREGFGNSRRAPEGFPKKGRFHFEDFPNASRSKNQALSFTPSYRRLAFLL